MGKPNFLKNIKRFFEKAVNKVKNITTKIVKPIQKIREQSVPLFENIPVVGQFIKPIQQISNEIDNTILDWAGNRKGNAVGTFSQDGKTQSQLSRIYDSVRNFGGTMASEMKRNGIMDRIYEKHPQLKQVEQGVRNLKTQYNNLPKEVKAPIEEGARIISNKLLQKIRRNPHIGPRRNPNPFPQLPGSQSLNQPRILPSGAGGRRHRSRSTRSEVSKDSVIESTEDYDNTVSEGNIQFQNQRKHRKQKKPNQKATFKNHQYSTPKFTEEDSEESDDDYNNFENFDPTKPYAFVSQRTPSKPKQKPYDIPLFDNPLN